MSDTCDKSDRLLHENEALQRRVAELESDVEHEVTLHELQVHQIELEVQNEELLRMQTTLEAQQRRYEYVYDHASVGYCTVTNQELILEANLYAATMLGVARGALIKQPLYRFILAEDQDTYYLFRNQTFEAGKTQTCELRMMSQDNTVFWAHLQETVVQDEAGTTLSHLVITNIAERKRAEFQLRESESRFRDMFERSTVGKAMTGPDGKLIKVNRAFADMLGLSIEELQQLTLSTITHPDDLNASWECIRALLTGETTSLQMEKRYKHRDGHWVHAATSATLLRAVAGTPRCLLASIIDISERKLAEKNLLEQGATLNAILESADSPIFSIDRDYRYTAFNSAHAAVMKALYGTDIRLGGSLAEYQAVPGDWHAARKNLDRAFRGETVVESALSGEDGRARRHFEVSHYPVRTEAGEIIGVSVFARETTARRRAEETVARMQSLLNETQRITKVGGWEYDLRTGQGTWTDEVYRIHGLTRGDDINGPAQAMAFYTPEDKPRIAEAFARAIEKGAPYDLELQLVNAKGERLWVRTLGHAEQDNGKTVRVFGNIMDLTERKQAEAEREHLEAQLRGAQRMEAIGVLAGGIAHDFNNLLSVILCSAEFAMARARDDDPIRDELLEVKKAGARAADLTRQLLAFSRKQVLQPVVLNLNRVAAGIEKMLHRILGEDIDYVQSLAPDLGMVFADPGQIEQVLMNLVVNARDAMPTGGRLTIETANVELDEDYAARHVAVKPGPYVHLAVTDTGCGMDEATKARVFEPFFTTKGIGKGTGLGLSTVYGIVKQSGGNIWVYSEPGHGTAFKIYLPRTRSLAATNPTLKAVVSDIRGTETILVVEDEEAIRGIASRILGAAGYTVLVAASASDALAVCHAHNAKIHLLLTDVVMPVMGGRALAEHVMALRPGIKVLYMSGYTDEALSHHGTLAQGTHFIAKPLGATALTRKVRETLDSDDDNPLEEQEKPLGAAPEVLLNPPPGKAAVRAVAPGILDSLRKATKAARYDEAINLVEAIRPTNPDLAMGLRRMVEAFDYDSVLDLLGR